MSSINKKLTAWVLAVIIAVATPVSAVAKDIAENDPRIEIINNYTQLEPQNPRSQELDGYIDDIMAQVIDDDMDTYEQLRACFDYVKANTSYGSHMANLDAKVNGTTCRQIYSKYGEIEGFGAVALAAKVGMCNAYASAFIMMARKIGFNAGLVRGETKNGYGGYAYHEWCEIEIDGTTYLFDPQLDQSLTRAGLAEYMVFCVTYNQVPGRFIKY